MVYILYQKGEIEGILRLQDYQKVIPLFDKCPLVGSKRQDYMDFVEAAKLMKEKAHLTQEGLELIRKIKLRMNKGRK